jgi:hypothetical protein
VTFRVVLALGLVVLVALCFPDPAFAWTPGTHVYLGESLLANLQLLPAATAELLRAFPFDFLYGNIAADSSIAKKYAPVGRHCHYWHVGQEIHDDAGSDALRAFGLGYLCHLAADVVAHNYFVPRQLVLTASTAAVGHAYWESRVETHLGTAYARAARDLIQMDTSQADAHLARIISPTLFSVGTNRRLFRGLVHLAETRGFQSGLKAAVGRSRWSLSDSDIEPHLGLSYDYMVELLSSDAPTPRQFDPSGERPLHVAKSVRRQVLQGAVRTRPRRLTEAADEHFGLPAKPLQWWPERVRPLPWRAPAPARLDPRSAEA